jgi:hypothetical protein
MAGEDHVVAGSFKNKVEATMAHVLPDTVTAEMHRNRAGGLRSNVSIASSPNEAPRLTDVRPIIGYGVCRLIAAAWQPLGTAADGRQECACCDYPRLKRMTKIASMNDRGLERNMQMELRSSQA